MMHNNQLWGVCLEECTVKSCGIKKDIRSWHCQESQPFCTKKSNEDAAVVQPVKRKVKRPWIWPLARRPEGQPSDTSFHMSLRKWSIRKVVIIKKPTQKKNIADAMTERKFTRGLNKPGMAAQLRENISQVVRESASLVCIFFCYFSTLGLPLLISSFAENCWFPGCGFHHLSRFALLNYYQFFFCSATNGAYLVHIFSGIFPPIPSCF